MRFLAAPIFVLLFTFTIGPHQVLAQAIEARFSAAAVEPPFSQEMDERFRALVEARFGNTLKLSSNLRLSSEEAVDRLQKGQLDLAVVSVRGLPGRAGQKARALEHPFTYPDVAALRKAAQSDVGGVILGTLPEEGILGLGLWTSGFTRIGSSQQIARLGDLRQSSLGTFGPPATRDVLAQLDIRTIQTTSADAPFQVSRGQFNASEITPNTVLAGPEGTAYRTVFQDPVRPRVLAVVARQEFWMSLPYRAQAGLAAIIDEQTDKIDQLAEKNDADFRAVSEARGVTYVAIPQEEIEIARLQSLAVWDKRSADPDKTLLESARLASLATFAFREPAPQRAQAEVFLATDRLDEGGNDDLAFGVKRARELNMAIARLDLPAREPLSTNIERTISVQKLDRFSDDTAFVSALKRSLGKQGHSRVLVYVHGYYNKFSFCLRRTAALSQELKFDGAVVLYSWPSLGEALAYGYDGDSVSISVDRFDKFMQLLEKATDRSKISVLAHSMGSRLWADYIHILKQRPGAVRKYDHVILAAADINSELFDQRHPEIAARARKLTLYAAETDRSLGISETVHSGLRLGRHQKGKLFVMPPTQTIDATSVAGLNGFWQHSYVFETKAGLADLRELLTRDTAPANRRGIATRQQDGKDYWQLLP